MTTSFAFHLFRGPAILALVLFPVVTKYFVHLPKDTLINVIIIVLGIAVTFRDVYVLIEDHMRQRIKKYLDSLVLDNIMKNIFDPRVGIVSCILSTIVGNASMYTLPMSQSQRVRLLQSCWLTSEEETEEILAAPGGIRLLLPTSLQQWLEPNRTVLIPDVQSSQKGMILEDGEESHEEASTQEEPSDSDPCDQDAHQKDIHQKVNRESRAKEVSIPLSESTVTPPLSPDPIQVLGSILKELTVSGIQKTFQRIPDSWVEGAAAASTVALVLHLRTSSRARRFICGALEGTTALSLAGLSLVTISGLLSKHSISVDSSHTPKNTFLLPVRRLVEAVRSRGDVRHLQASVALFVLYYFGLRRKRINSGTY